MAVKYCSIIRNYVFSVSSQRNYNFYHQSTLLTAFPNNYRSIVGRNPSMGIPLLANQDLTPMLSTIHFHLAKDTPKVLFNLKCVNINASSIFGINKMKKKTKINVED